MNLSGGGGDELTGGGGGGELTGGGGDGNGREPHQVEAGKDLIATRSEKASACIANRNSSVALMMLDGIVCEPLHKSGQSTKPQKHHQTRWTRVTRSQTSAASEQTKFVILDACPFASNSGGAGQGHLAAGYICQRTCRVRQ